MVFFSLFFRPEVVSDGIFGMVVAPTVVKVSLKFGQAAVHEIYDCLTLLRTTTTTTTTTPADGPYGNRAKRHKRRFA